LISRTKPSTREIKVMNPTLRTERMENIRGQTSDVRGQRDSGFW
jgi:hypothetical protein